METPFLTWADEYAIGHKGLDAEHRQLTEAINDICTAERTKEQLRPFLDALAVATVEHFKHENMLLRELGSWALRLQPDRPAMSFAESAVAINEHCAEHAHALLRLEAIVHTFYSDPDFNREKLAKTLVGWFVEHAVKQDAELKDVLEAYVVECNAVAVSSSR